MRFAVEWKAAARCCRPSHAAGRDFRRRTAGGELAVLMGVSGVLLIREYWNWPHHRITIASGNVVYAMIFRSFEAACVNQIRVILNRGTTGPCPCPFTKNCL